jgi:3D (Asp-Asp-Asp) domain-containing protein
MVSESIMDTANQLHLPYGRLFWRCLPIVLMPLLLLFAAKPLAQRRFTPPVHPDYLACLHYTDLLYAGIKRDPVIVPPIPMPLTRRMLVSAYCSCARCCGAGSRGVTASGHVIRSGDVFAAGPADLAIGTSIIIPGYNSDRPVMVLDRGGAMQGDKLDVFFSDHQAALEWGIRDVTIIIETPYAPLTAAP